MPACPHLAIQTHPQKAGTAAQHAPTCARLSTKPPMRMTARSSADALRGPRLEWMVGRDGEWFQHTVGAPTAGHQAPLWSTPTAPLPRACSACLRVASGLSSAAAGKPASVGTHPGMNCSGVLSQAQPATAFRSIPTWGLGARQGGEAKGEAHTPAVGPLADAIQFRGSAQQGSQPATSAVSRARSLPPKPHLLPATRRWPSLAPPSPAAPPRPAAGGAGQARTGWSAEGGSQRESCTPLSTATVQPGQR